MAIKTMPEKRFRYILEDTLANTETELEIDPKGWDNHEIGFERSDDFGLNIQNVVPLSFSGVGRDMLNWIYFHNGIFGKSKTRIEKRQDNWTYAPFYTYKHDYSTFKDDLKYVEMAGLEDGLMAKFDTYKDTEYEIDLPAVGSKVFIDYTGASYVTTNQIQCLYGEMGGEKVFSDNYLLKGNRAVRAYNDKVGFIDNKGLPFTGMTFKALETTIIDLNIVLKLTIEADGAFLANTPSSGRIRIIQHDSNFGNGSVITPTFSPSVTYPFTPSSTSSPGNNRIDTFNTTTKATFTIQSGMLYSIMYAADDKNYDDVSVTDGSDCYIEVTNKVDSAYKNSKLEAFSYEWLIAELLKKIDPTAVFESTVAYPNVKELLTCTPCIRNMGKTDGTGKIKTTLEDVLESFNKLKCIAIDITGNKMTIGNRLPMIVDNNFIDSSFYPDQNYGEIEVNDIKISHDSKHQYNKVKVGADTDDREDDDPLIYPFICEKEYSIKDTIAEGELDLVNNFMLDPYAIDKYIIDTITEADNKDECEFAVFAANETLSFSFEEIVRDNFRNWHDTDTKNIINFDCFAIVTSETITVQQKAIVRFGFTTTTTDTLNLYNTKSRITISNVEGTVVLDDVIYNLDVNFDLYSCYLYEGTWVIKVSCITPRDAESDITIINTVELKGYDGGSEVLVEYLSNYNIYKNHLKPITNFVGDSNTIYNIPLTPQRILQRWADYLAISVYGSQDVSLKYCTTKILNSGIISRCDYEDADVVENSDLNLVPYNPLFLPATISVNTQEEILNIQTFENNEKYKYFQFKDEKTNRTYKGWINSITFAPTKNKSKEIILQAKQI